MKNTAVKSDSKGGGMKCLWADMQTVGERELWRVSSHLGHGRQWECSFSLCLTHLQVNIIHHTELMCLDTTSSRIMFLRYDLDLKSRFVTIFRIFIYIQKI